VKFDKALAETVNGYYKSELGCGPARTGPGRPSKTSSWPPWVGCTGTTPGACTATSTTYRPQSSKPRSTPQNGPTSPWSKSNSPSLHQNPSEPGRFSTFLADAVSLAIQEQGTIAWFALRIDTTTFWIVDAFPSDGERLAHLKGAIASSLLANAERLLDELPEIPPADVLAAKLPQ